MTSTSNFKKHKDKYSIIKYGKKKFSNDELDEVLSKIAKFNADGIHFIHLKDSVKKNFVKIKIAEFKFKDILVFLDENGLVQRIPFDDKSGFHDFNCDRIRLKYICSYSNHHLVHE